MDDAATLEKPVVIVDKNFRALETASFEPFLGDVEEITSVNIRLEWVDVDDLVIDTRYQREIGDRGRRNILKIARKFSWSKFAPVIASPIQSHVGKFAIVDGQHRTTAAKLRKIQKVPCLIGELDQFQQANAFSEINSVVTAVTPLQLHAARVASGDPEALKYTNILAKAGVHICRYPVVAHNMKIGDSLAVTVLQRLLQAYEEDIFVLALKCITKTGTGNPGLVRPAIVKALCINLRSRPNLLQNPEFTINKLKQMRLDNIYRSALADAVSSQISETEAVGARLVDHFYDVFGEAKF